MVRPPGASIIRPSQIWFAPAVSALTPGWLSAPAVRPIFRPTFEALAYCAVSLGQPDKARHWLARMRAMDGPESHFLAPLKRNIPGYEARLAELLRRAEV
ncbi:MAG: hypothetical protein AB7F22_04780 [Reyranella sp.]|uniref:hypothetical protein n=1 Tax=Reyranella sp. TaxID=1929291 RepID=UPI003D118CCF